MIGRGCFRSNTWESCSSLREGYFNKCRQRLQGSSGMNSVLIIPRYPLRFLSSEKGRSRNLSTVIVYYSFILCRVILFILYQLQLEYYLKMEKRRAEVQTYLKERVNPILEALVLAIIKSRPENIISYAVEWLTERGDQLKVSSNNDDVDSEEENDVIDEMEFNKKKKESGKRNRSAVSAEVYGEFNKKAKFVPKCIEKSDDTNTRLLILMSNSFLFKGLDQKDADIVKGAMEEKFFKAGEFIIKEGEKGDELFMVDEGELECTKMIKGSNVFIKNYTVGESFGELALLYNSPRAASVQAKTDTRLFVLDRVTFNAIVKQGTQKKKDMFDSILSQVELLDSIDPYERSRICDVLKDMSFGVGEYVIRQGDMGDKFYIVVEGQLVAERANQKGEQNAVYNYKTGDYFGEIALVRNIPRQASVKALTPVRLVYIERNTFKRILGPIEDILKRNQDRYKKFWSSPQDLQ